MASTALSMGAHAQEVAVKAQRLVPQPEGLSIAEAAALPFGGHTALHFLRDGARLQAGERLLVIGASGAVGLAMVQLGRHIGAEVTAVTSAANAALVQGMGAARVIDYRAGDFRASVGPQEVIVDCVGETDTAAARAMLVPGGRFCRVVASLDAVILAGWHGRRLGIRVLAGSGAEAPADLAWLADLAASGPLRPHIGATFPFAQIAEAHALCDSGRKRGNAVVLFDPLQTPA
jgi:NADPH:quinone reductase-like Zn-dependent oxidoreductase